MPEQKPLRELAIEAYDALWEKYHEDIEGLEYTLSKTHAFMQSPIFEGRKYISEKFELIATITPKGYDFEKVREIIPPNFEYKGKEYSVIISMPLLDLFNDSPKVYF